MPVRDTSLTYSKRSLHGQDAHEIGIRIMSGELAIGATLPNESEFSGRLNVSRTELRESIKVLAAKGLLESRPKIGTRVRPRAARNMLDPDVLAWRLEALPAESLVSDLFEVRHIIEPAPPPSPPCTLAENLEMIRVARQSLGRWMPGAKPTVAPLGLERRWGRERTVRGASVQRRNRLRRDPRQRNSDDRLLKIHGT